MTLYLRYCSRNQKYTIQSETTVLTGQMLYVYIYIYTERFFSIGFYLPNLPVWANSRNRAVVPSVIVVSLKVQLGLVCQ